MIFRGEGWHIRPMRCEVGVGSGTSAATFSVVLDVPEWIGAFGSAGEDLARQKLVQTAVLEQVAQRLSPGEKLRLLKMVPVANRVRPAWDR